MKKKGISLIYLIILVVVMIVIAGAIMITLFRQNPVQEAKDLVTKSAMQKMIDDRNTRYKELLASNFGDESKIKDEDFIGVISSDYTELQFYATKTGIVYRGENDKTKTLAKEMGIIITDKSILPGIKDIILSSTTSTIHVNLKLEESGTPIHDFRYLLSGDGVTWREYASDEAAYVFQRLRDNTSYQVKVKIEDENGNEAVSGVRNIATKELLVGTVSVKIGSKTGNNYAGGTWVNDSLYVMLNPSSTGSSSYEVTGANRIPNGTQTDTLLINEGESNIVVTTTDGTNVKTGTQVVAKIDKTLPTFTTSVDKITTNKATVSVQNPYDSLSGMKDYTYYIDGTQKLKGTELACTFEKLTQGTTHVVKIVVTDKAENERTIETNVVIGTLPDANTAVVTEIAPTNWTNTDVILKMKFTDHGRDDIVAQYSEDNITFRDVTTPYTVAIPNNKEVYVRYRDAENQTGATKTIRITNIDKVKPTTTMTPNGGQYAMPSGTTKATLKTRLTATDGDGSGLATVQYAWSQSNTVEPTTGWTNFNGAGEEITKTDATKGTWYVWTKVIDHATNRADTIKVSDEFGVDEPKIVLKPSPSGWTTGNVTVSVEYGGPLTQNRKAGIQGQTLVNGATSVVATAQNQIVYAEATDSVGNKVTATLKIGNIDRVKPVSTIAPNGGEYVIPTGGTKATIKTTLGATDLESGLATVQYAWSTSNTTEPTAGWTNFNGAGEEITKTDATEGNWYLWMKVIDTVGNRADVVKLSNAFTVHNNVTTDNMITLTASPTGWTNGNVTVTVAYGKNLSKNRKAGVGSASTANATAVTVTAQNQIVYAEATDVAGNKVTATLQIQNIDKVKPTTTVAPNGGQYVIPSGGTQATLKTRITAEDTGGSGLQTVQYAWSTSDTIEPISGWLDYEPRGQDIQKADATVGKWYVWTKVTDVAGNRADVMKVSGAFTVNPNNTVDNMISLVPNTTSWTNQDVKVAVNYGRNVSQNRKAGIGSATTANATEVVVTAQNQIVYAEATDAAGNKVTASLQIKNIDKEKPTTTITPNGGQYIVPTGATTSTLRTRLTAFDLGESGLLTTEYAWSNSNTTEPTTGWTTYGASGTDIEKTGATEGNWYVWTRVIDKAGNRAEVIKVSNAFVVNDPQAEANRIELTADKKDWTNQDVIVSVKYGQNISQNRKAGIQGSTLVNDAISVRVSVQNQVAYAEGTDAAGNKVTATLQISNIDKVLPTTTVTPNGGSYVVPTGMTQATLKTRVTAADTGGSNLNTVQYAWSTSPTNESTIAESAWQNFTAAGQDVTKTDATRGDWYLWTRVIDKAGNRAENIKVSAKFTVADNAAITITPDKTGWTAGDVIASINYDARLTQNRKAGIQGQSLGANVTSVTATAQNQVIYAEATDVAGNKVFATLQITNIDKVLPTTTITPNGGQYVLPTGKTQATIKTTLTAKDQESGLKTVQYAWSNSQTVEPTTGWTNFTAAGQEVAKTDATAGDWYLWTKVLDNVDHRAESIKVSAKFTVNDSTNSANKITLTANPTKWTNGNVIVSVDYGTNLPLNRKAGIGAANTNNATTITATTQGQVIYAEATDIAGNKTTATLTIGNIDRVLPTTTIAPNGGQFVVPTGATSATIKTRITANDEGGSGLATVQYAWSNSNTTEPTAGWTNYTAAGQEVAKTDASEGNWYLWTKVIDTAGNRADNIKVSNVFVVNDPDAAANRITLTANPTDWTNGNVAVTVTYGANLSQNRKAGIKGSTLADGATMITVTTQGQVAYAEATDGAGNKVYKELPINNIDKELPTAGISPNGGQYVLPTGNTKSTLKARLTAADTGGSNLNTVQYAWSNSNTTEPTTWENYIAAGQDITKTDATKGNWYLWTKVIDKAGNRATTIKVSNAFTVNDSTDAKNAITLTKNPTGWTNGSVVVSVAYGANLTQDRKAGIQGGTLTGNATSVTIGLQNQIAYAEATDVAGNKVVATLVINNIDKELPTAGISPNGGQYVLPTGATKASLKTRVTAADTGGSGLSTVQYAWSNSATVEPTTGWTNYTAAGQDVTFTDATVGNWYLWTKVTDTAGNRAVTIKVSNAFTVNDTTQPDNAISLSQNITAWTNQDVTVAVTYGKNLNLNRKAGIKGGALTAGATSVVVGTQNQVAYAEATDAAGNKVYKELPITNIDKIKPTTTMSPNGGQYIVPTGTTTATLKSQITAADTGGSGLKTIEYAWSNSGTAEPTTGWTTFNAAGTEVTKTGAAEGNWYLWTRVIDTATNRADTIKVSNAFVVNDPNAEANRITLTAPTAWTNQDVVVTVKYGANVSQNRKAGIQGGTLVANATSVTVTTQNQVVYAEGTDSAGNKVSATLQVSKIDKVPPTATISPNGGNYVLPTGANIATIKARLTAADTGGSGLGTTEYAWSDSATVEPTTGWTAFTAAGQDVAKTNATKGNWYLWTRVIDTAGNRATNIKVSAAFTVNDTSPDHVITLTKDKTDWTNGNVIVGVTYGKYLTANRKAGIKNSTLTADALTVAITTQNQVAYAEATDAAGNKVTAELTVTNIDKTAPTVTLTPDGGKHTVPTGATVATIKTNIKVVDTGGSGLKTVQYAWSTSGSQKPTTGWVNFTPPEFNISEPNMGIGSHYLWLNVIDAAGNPSTKVVSGDFNVGTATIQLTKDITAMTNSDVTVAVGYGDILTQNRKAGVGSASTAGATSVKVTAENQTVYAEATDIAGNKVTANLLVNNIDKTAPRLTSLNVTSPATGTYSAGKQIIVRATYSEPIKGTAPTLKIKFGNDGSERTMTPSTASITTPTTTIDYTYTIVNGDNGDLMSTNYSGTVTDAVGNALNVTNMALIGNKITANTVPLKVSGFAVTTPATGTYKAGQVVTVVATWTEKLAGTPPTLKIRFGSGTERTMTTGAINGATVSYTYTIAAGDNGALALTNYSGGAITDIYGNVGTPELKPLTGSAITADTTAPAVNTIAVTAPGTGTYQAGQVVTMVATWSEPIKGTAPTLKLKFGSSAERTATTGSISGSTITYTYTIAAGDNGVLTSTSYTGGSISDNAGNTGTASLKGFTGNTITADTTAPQLSSISATAPASGTYKAGQVVTMIATWNENVKGTVPTLKIKFGSSAERSITSGTISGNTITYTYTIVAGDNGTLTTVDYTGGSLTDMAGNGGVASRKDMSGNTIVADTAAPTCNITASTSSPTNAASITYTFTFNEAVTGFTADDITITNGTKGAFAGSGSVYTLVVSNAGTCTQTVAVAAGTCTDLVGNANIASNTISISIDRTAPKMTALAVTSPAAGTYKAGQAVTIVATWDKQIKGTAPTLKIKFGSGAERTIASGTVSGNTVTYTYTIAAGDNGLLAATSCTGGAITDSLGNPGSAVNLTLTGNAITADTTAPTCTVTASTPSPTKASTVQYTFKFSEDIVDFAIGDIVVTNGTKGLFTKYNASQYILEVSNTGSCIQTVSVPANVCTDIVGNNNLASNTLSMTIDRTPPVLNTLQVTSPVTGTYKAGQTVTMVATWSEAIKGTVPTLNLKFGTGTARTVTTGTISGSTITYQYTIQAGDNGVLSSTGFTGGSITDTAGNAGTPENKAIGGNVITADTTAPTCNITANVASPSNASSVTYTFTFSENVLGFNADDITVTNGTKGTFAGSGNVYTLVVTNAGTTTQTVSVAANTCTDAVGNNNVASNTVTINIDRTAPVLQRMEVLSPATGTYTIGKEIMIVAYWDKPIKGTAPTLKVKFGTGTERSITTGTISGSSITYKYTIQSGDNGLLASTAYSGGNITDLAGNVGTPTLKPLGLSVITADTIAPSCQITSNVGSLTNAASITYTFTFSEAVTGFAADDVTVTNGTKGTFAGSGSVYTLVVTNTGTTTQTVSVPAGKCTDIAGNNNLVSNTLTTSIDRTSPTCTVASSSPNPTNAQTITCTFTFSEVVTGFTSSDILLNTGTITSFTGSGTSYTAVIGNLGNATVMISVDANKCTDAAGNGNTASNSLSITVDRVQPYPTVEYLALTNPTNESSVNYRIKFTKDVIGFTKEDIYVTNGSVTSLTGSGNTYIATIANNESENQEVFVPANMCTDLIGNSNRESNHTSLTIDRTAPTCTISASESSPTNASSITYTITFSEMVQNFIYTDVSITNGFLSSFNVTGNTYTVVVSNSGSTKQSVSVKAGVCTDAAGNANLASSVHYVDIDRTAPVVTVTADKTSPTNSASIKYKFAIDEDFVGSIDYSDIIVSNGTVGGISGAGNAYETTISNSGTCVQSVYIRAGAITDRAGNPNEKSNTLTFVVDRTAPTVTLTPDAGDVAIPPGSASATISTKLTATDSGGSGLDTLQYAFTAPGVTAEPTSWNTFTNGATVSLAKCSAGEWNLWLKVLDKAGNRNTPIKKTFTVGSAVARIGTSTYYLSLQKAFDAATTSSTVTLLSNVTENVKVVSGKNFTFNGDSKVITGTFQNSGTVICNNIDLNSSSGTTFSNSGTATLQSGAIRNLATSAAVTNTGTLTIKDTWVYAEKSRSLGNSGGTTYIQGTTGISTGTGAAGYQTVYNYSAGTIEMTGGTIASSAGVPIVNEGKFTMTNGTASGTASGFATIINRNGGIFTCSGLVKASLSNAISNAATYTMTQGSAQATGANVTVSNTAGTFTLTGGSITATQVNAFRNASGATLEVKGGGISNNCDNTGNSTIMNYGVMRLSAGNIGTSGSRTPPAITNYSGGEATVSGTVLISNYSAPYATFNNFEGAKLTMTGGKIQNGVSTSNAIYNTGTVNKTGGTAIPNNFGI